MKRRKSLRKEVIKVTVEGKDSRIHFTVPQPQAQIQKYTKNTQLISFGKITIGGKVLKAYAFKNNPKLVFLRIDESFIPLSKYQMRELLSLTMRMGRYLGILGRKKRKKQRKTVSTNTVYNKL